MLRSILSLGFTSFAYVRLFAQEVPYGLFAEQLSGTAFTAPRRSETGWKTLEALYVKNVWTHCIDKDRALSTSRLHLPYTVKTAAAGCTGFVPLWATVA